MNPRAIIALLALVLAGCAQSRATESSSGTAERVRIGAWNIEWLGHPEKRFGERSGVEQTPDDLADVIVAADVSILALAEISATDRPDDGWTNRTLDEALQIVSSRTGGDWRHRLFPDRRDGEQITGIAWDARRVAAIGEPVPLAVSNEPGPLERRLWSRPPWAMKFALGPGRTDVVVIPIHMKSNYSGDFAPHRAAEAQALVDALPAIRAAFADEDVLVIGDSNAKPGEPALAVFAESGFRDANAHGAVTHTFVGAIDRAFLPVDQPEFADDRFAVIGADGLPSRGWSNAQFMVHASDHALIVVEVVVMDDDD